MPVYKFEDAWRVQWRDPATRKRRTRSFPSKAEAEAFAQDRRKERELVRRGFVTARQVSERRYVLAVDGLCDRFMEHARTYYRKPDGRPTSMIHNLEMALRPLRKLYGSAPAADFGPQALKAVREAMIEQGWCRALVNRSVTRLRSVFRWGVEQEHVPASVLEGLRAVAPLRRGRCEARETEPVRPVPEAHIDKLREHLSRQVWAVIELQRLTGMRPGEALAMRGRDLDTKGQVWTYTPASHKTEHHGHGRTVYLGPRAQAVLRPFLQRDLSAYLFDPQEAVAERAADAPSHRRPDQQPTRRRTDRVVGEHYTTESYRRAIERACAAAGVPTWSPNRLRHNAATFLRREYGIDLAQTILGHALGSTITEVYAEANVAKAREVVGQVG